MTDDDRSKRKLEENKMAEGELLDEVRKLRETTERAARLRVVQSELRLRRRDARAD